MKNMLKNSRFVGIIILLILMSSITSVSSPIVIKQMDNVELTYTKSNGDPDLSIEIIPQKERFPRFHKEGTIFNATIIVTNNGPENFEKFGLYIRMYQSFPDPRVPNEHEIHESINLLEPGESYEVNLSWNPGIQGFIPIGIFPLFASISKDNNRIKFREKYFIVYRFGLFGEPLIDFQSVQEPYDNKGGDKSG